MVVQLYDSFNTCIVICPSEQVYLVKKNIIKIYVEKQNSGKVERQTKKIDRQTGGL